MDFHRRLNIILEREEDDTDAIGTVAIFRRHNGDLQVLVTKRELPPSAGSWTLPGGHVKKGEKPVDGAKREIQEETGLTISKPTFVKTQKAAAGRGRVEFIFTVTASGSSKVNSGSDSRSLKWVNVNALPRLAFSHTAAIHDAAVKLYGESYLKEYYLPRAVSICEDVSEGKKLKKTVQGILDQKHRDDSGLLIVFEGIDGVGKCFGRDTPVLMADGTTRMVQDVIVGDRVMGADSTPREVISLGRGREMMYRVTPERGDPYVVNESHILSLEIRDGDDDKFADHTNRVSVTTTSYLTPQLNPLAAGDSRRIHSHTFSIAKGSTYLFLSLKIIACAPG
jgi:ADP-ribose pyrophosphatase YjhB (NUDIX family)